MEKINISALSCWRSGGELAEQRLLGVWQGSDVHARMPSVTCPSAFFIMSIQELAPMAPTCSCGTIAHRCPHVQPGAPSSGLLSWRLLSASLC